jgi:hypothetical protein
MIHRAIYLLVNNIIFTRCFVKQEMKQSYKNHHQQLENELWKTSKQDSKTFWKILKRFGKKGIISSSPEALPLVCLLTANTISSSEIS